MLSLRKWIGALGIAARPSERVQRACRLALMLCVALTSIAATAQIVIGPAPWYNPNYAPNVVIRQPEAEALCEASAWDMGLPVYNAHPGPCFIGDYNDGSFGQRPVATLIPGRYYQVGFWSNSCCGRSIYALGFNAPNPGYNPTKSMGSGDPCTCGEGANGGASRPGNIHIGGRSDSWSSLVADPIDSATGNAYLQEDDFTDIPALTLRRFYNSSPAMFKTPMGNGWRHSFDRSIAYAPATSTFPATAAAYRPDGRQIVFTKSNGVWITDPDLHEQLVEQDDSSGNPATFMLYVSATRHYETYKVVSSSGYLSGEPISIVDEAGRGVSLTYSTALTSPSVAPKPDLLLYVTDDQGRQLSFSYDANAMLSSVTLPDGNVVSYTHGSDYVNNVNSVGNLTAVQYPSGTKQYLYDEPSLAGGSYHVLTGVVDETGTRYESTGYNGNRQAIYSSFANGVGATNINYSTDGTSTILYSLGVSVTRGFSVVQGIKRSSSQTQGCGFSCGSPWKTTTYDANGSPQLSTDFDGNAVATLFSPLGLLTQQVDAQGQPTQRTTNLTWNTTLRVPLTRAVLDSSNNTVAYSSWAYNSFGQATSRCEADPSVSGATSYSCGSSANAPTGVRQWRYTYCNATDGTQCPLVGLLLSVDGPRTDVSDVTSYNYYMSSDLSGCATVGGACHRLGDLRQVTNALGQMTMFVAYDLGGRVARLSDANGVITDLTYYPRGWLHTRTVRANADGSASGGDAVTALTYTAYGAIQTVADPDGVTMTYGYDASHRLTDITDAAGDHIHYTLDAAGNKTQEQVFDPNGAVRRSLARAFNTLGQLTQVKDGLNNAVFNASFADSYDANGNLKHSSDANSIEQWRDYDGLNRLQMTIDNYNGADASTKNTQSTFSMDADDRLEGVKDPDGLNTVYSYDGLGNATGVQSPDTGTTTNEYDAAGNLTKRTDARGVVTQYTYDTLNRRTQVIYPAHPALNITYTYDQSAPIGGCPNNFNVGHLTTMTDASGTTSWCYTNQGDIREVKQVINGVAYLHGYAYTLGRRLVYLQYPSGFELKYGYDAAGRTNTVGYLQQPGPFGSYTNATLTPLITGVTYFPFGGATGYTWAQGNQSESRTYDGNGQVSDVTSGALNLHFRRDGMGSIVAEGTMPGANPATESYQYDSLYRLTEMDDGTGAKEQSFTYSKTGDRLSATTGTQPAVNYTYQAGTHFLSNVGGLARVPDSNGNTTAMTAPNGLLIGLGYDDRNLLTAVTNAGSTIANYQYNGLGYRVWRTITSPSTEQMAAVYDPAGTGNLYGEYFATDYREYVYLNGIPVASATDAGRAAPSINYLHADHLGALRGVTDTSGNVVYSWTWQDNAFGDQPKSGAANFYIRFPGQYYDIESGLNYNVNRYYEAATGRYVQSDPYGLAAGPNTYAYALSSPLELFDPLGLQANLNLFTPGSQAWLQAQALPQEPGVFSVAGHGSPRGIYDQRDGSDLLNENSLAKAIRQAGYDGHATIKLYSCNTGIPGDIRRGDMNVHLRPLGQRLASVMGSDVLAPNNWGYMVGNGSDPTSYLIGDSLPHATWDSTTTEPQTYDPSDKTGRFVPFPGRH